MTPIAPRTTTRFEPIHMARLQWTPPSGIAHDQRTNINMIKLPTETTSNAQVLSACLRKVVMLPNELDMLREMVELSGFPLGLTSANTTKGHHERTTNCWTPWTRKKCTKQEPPPKRRRLIKRVNWQTASKT